MPNRDTTVPADEDRQPFAAWLLAQAGGKTHADLTKAMQEVTAAVLDTGKAGTITLTIKVDLLDKKGAAPGSTQQIRVADAIAVKVPQHPRPTSVFWTDKKGDLTRNDPASFDLGALRVPDPTLPDTSTLREPRA